MQSASILSLLVDFAQLDNYTNFTLQSPTEKSEVCSSYIYNERLIDNTRELG